MIPEFFKDLTQLEGIEGIALYSYDNEIVDSWVDSNFNIKIFEEIGINYFQILLSLGKFDNKFDEIVISHENGQIYVKPLPDIMIVIAFRLKVDVALIRLIINLGVSGLFDSKKHQKILKKFSSKTKNFLKDTYLDDSERAYIKRIVT